jgi:hypothetical protein
MLDNFRIGARSILPCLLWLIATGHAQSQGSVTYNRTPAIDDSQSQAEKVAEETVSLSAEKIISLLQKEPGLLLEFKKLLVRKAFEQGRVLEAGDLTDDALFRLVNEDEHIRVLATQEIERRFYIRALPTKDELERERMMGTSPETMLAANRAAGSQNAAGQGFSREDLYWQSRARMEANPADQSPYTSPRTSPTPPANGNPQLPTPGQNSRTVLRADGRLADTPPPDSDTGDSLQMPRVRPEDLPQLLSASAVPSNGLGGQGPPLSKPMF